MPEIREGLEVDGHPVAEPDNFETTLAEQAGKESAAKTPTARPDPAVDSAQDIAAGILSSTGSTDIRDGLEAKLPPEPAEAPAAPFDISQLSPDAQEAYKAAGRELEAEKLELDAGREALATLAEQDYLTSIEDAATENELVAAVAAYRERVPEEVASEALWDLAANLSGADPESEDDEDLEEIDAIYRLLDARVRLLEQGLKAAESAEMAEQLLPMVAEQRVKDLGETYSRWLSDKGMSEAEGGRRLEAVRETLAEDGIDLSQLIQQPNFDAKQGFYDLLTAAEAADHGARKAAAIHAFQEEVAGATSTNVSEGLTQMSPWGPFSLQDLRIPAVPQERVNEYAQRRAEARRVTADSIRSSVAEPEDTSVSSGYTDGAGRPLSVDDATGARERWEQQQRDELARTRGLLR